MSQSSDRDDYFYALMARRAQLFCTNTAADEKAKYLIQCLKLLDYGAAKTFITHDTKLYFYDEIITHHHGLIRSVATDLKKGSPDMLDTHIPTLLNMLQANELITNNDRTKQLSSEVSVTISQRLKSNKIRFALDKLKSTRDNAKKGKEAANPFMQLSMGHSMKRCRNDETSESVKESAFQMIDECSGFRRARSLLPPGKVSQHSEYNERGLDLRNSSKPQFISPVISNPPLVKQNSSKAQFISPVISKPPLEKQNSTRSQFIVPKMNKPTMEKPCQDQSAMALKNMEPKLVDLILAEVMSTDLNIGWEAIAGLELVKQTLQEIVVWPLLRPDIFTGLRGPPKGLLLFGPPGTGKTLIGRCVASQSKATFFCISASSLTSKWVGEGEKLVRTLFLVAKENQPAVIFIDEVDSLLTKRTESDHESSRRIKTEFLVQMDGTGTDNDDRILLIGATNRPQEIDDAARRRFTKRLYVPLPTREARKEIIQCLLRGQGNTISEKDCDEISELTDGFSGADVTSLCKEAAMGPIRKLSRHDIMEISADRVPPIDLDDFKNALNSVKSSVTPSDLKLYEKWNMQFGSCQIIS